MRRSPLRRTSRLNPRSKTKAYARRERDVEYMRAVKGLPCALHGVDGAGQCSGPVEADHAGDRGLGQKADDRTCVPLCARHHRDRTDVHGFFATLTRDERRAWCRHAIARTTHAIACKRAGVEHKEH